MSAAASTGDPALTYRDVWFSYAGAEKPAIEGISLDVTSGERLGVLGPNGGGKSTLLKLTLGLLSLSGGSTGSGRGEIRVLGMAPVAAARAGLVGYVAQRSTAELAFPLSVQEAVGLGPALELPFWKRRGAALQRAVDEALDVVGARALADAHVGSLSGGQLQRVMIARALARRPKLLLLDEPTVGIDVAGQQQFASLLERLHAELRVTVVVVSHDIRTVAAGCDRVACLSRTLHCHVAPQGLTPSVLAEVFRHDVAAMFGELHVDAHPARGCTDPAHAHGLTVLPAPHQHGPGCGCPPATRHGGEA